MPVPNIAAIITCDDVSRIAPYSLIRVRRTWATPPKRLVVYVEVQNPTREAYSFSIYLSRGKSIVQQSEAELVLRGQRRVEHIQIWDTLDIEPKSHRMMIEIDGVAAASVGLDFGDPTACVMSKKTTKPTPHAVAITVYHGEDGTVEVVGPKEIKLYAGAAPKKKRKKSA
jgi:hypothetical protein